MTEENNRIVHIWDDPESRINFLETVLKGQSWEAKIYQPPVAGAEPLQNLVGQLQQKGYRTELGQDENGLATLSVKNFGDDTKLLTAVKDMGLTAGVGYKLTHIREPLGNAMHKTKELFKHVATDKARLLGGLYLLGDVFLIGAGFGNKDGGHGGGHGFKGMFKDPANLLQSATGIAATAQSLIYMAFAKEGGEAIYSELMKKAETASAQGTNLFDDAMWQDAGKKPGLGIVSKVFKDHPLQIGAFAQILGQVSLFGSGGIRFARAKNGIGPSDPTELAAQKSGAFKDMITAVNSIAGWSLMMKKPKEIEDEDKLPWSNPKRIWQEAQASPNQFASGFLGVASVAGVGAAMNKKNNVQMLANVTYLVGDGVMFATNSNHYGAEGMNNADMLSDAAEKFVVTSPMILGKDEQAQFVGQLSKYVATRTASEAARKEKRDVSPQEVEELAGRIAYGLNSKLPETHPKTYEVAGKAAAIVSKFHPAFANQIAAELATAICEAPSVMISQEELQQSILAQTDLSPNVDIVEMKHVAKPMADLAFAIPGGANAERVNRLYDAIDDLVKPTPKAGLQLEQTINETATQDVQQAVAQTAQDAGVGSHVAALQASRAVPQPQQHAAPTR